MALLALCLILVPMLRHSKPAPVPLGEAPHDYPFTDVDRSRGEPLKMGAPTDTTTIPEFPLPAPPPPPTGADLPIEEPPDLAGGPPLPHGDAPIEMAAIPQSSEMALRPRVIVHPRVPEKIIQKLKIDDAILLQALVGQDGRVHQVRVLRPIDNCQECTQSAIEAAQQFSYDPPPAGKGPAEVWTTPFEIRFSYRR